MKKARQLSRPKNTSSKKFNARKDRDLLYDTAWTKYRFRFLHHNPQCYVCSEQSTVVDHLRPHKGDTVLFKKLDNHIPLCKRCHDFITASFDRHEDPNFEWFQKKLTWMKERRDFLQVKVRVKVLDRYDC